LLVKLELPLSCLHIAQRAQNLGELKVDLRLVGAKLDGLLELRSRARGILKLGKHHAQVHSGIVVIGTQRYRFFQVFARRRKITSLLLEQAV